MSDLIVERGERAQWYRLVREAAQHASRELDAELESYLVLLLMRFCGQPKVVERVLALEYLQAVQAQRAARRDQLRDVGDQCLLFAGMFPQIAERRLVRIGYYVELGRGAYQQLAESLNQTTGQLYGELSAGFVELMEVLQSTRELGGSPSLSPLEAIELWQDTGSERARTRLGRLTDAEPVVSGPPRRWQ